MVGPRQHITHEGTALCLTPAAQGVRSAFGRDDPTYAKSLARDTLVEDATACTCNLCRATALIWTYDEAYSEVLSALTARDRQRLSEAKTWVESLAPDSMQYRAAERNFSAAMQRFETSAKRWDAAIKVRPVLA